MRKQLYTISLLLCTLLMLVSFSNNPPNGRTGAPGEGLCTDCHSPTNPPQDGQLLVEGIPDMIAPNTTYPVTVTVRNPNGQGSLAGFQMTILTPQNQAAGTMDNPDLNSAITSANNKQYFEHNPALSFDSNNEASWTMEWTSPAGPLESGILWFAVGNVADGGGSNQNDRVITRTGSGTITNVSSVQSQSIAQLKVYPNPTSDVLHIATEQSIDEISFYTIDGALIDQQIAPNRTMFDVSNYQPGIYMIRAIINDEASMSKWIKN